MIAMFIYNESSRYGTERCFSGLHLANTLVKNDPLTEVATFLLAGAVSCGGKGQETADEDYSLERTLKRFKAGAHRLVQCGNCVDARGLNQAGMVELARRSSMDELATATFEARSSYSEGRKPVR